MTRRIDLDYADILTPVRCLETSLCHMRWLEHDVLVNRRKGEQAAEVHPHPLALGLLFCVKVTP
jgi:hypothetical protein